MMKWSDRFNRHTKAAVGVALAVSILAGVAIGSFVAASGSGDAESPTRRSVKGFALDAAGLAAADNEIGFHILVPTEFATGASELLGVATMPGDETVMTSPLNQTLLTFGPPGVAQPNPAKGDASLEIRQLNREETSDIADPNPPPPGAHTPEPSPFVPVESPIPGVRITRQTEPGRTIYRFTGPTLGTIDLLFGGASPSTDADAIRMFQSMK